MILKSPPLAVVGYFFRLWLSFRRLLPKGNCQAFSIQGVEKGPRIENIYVINLDREPGRWYKIKQELRRILDMSGTDLLGLTERYVAVDANEFSKDPLKDANIDPFYSLADQLFVEPQPLVFPTHFELNTPIRMSRAEIAVAQSHINIWQKIAASTQEYSLILEDDVWFRSDFARYMSQVWDEIVTEIDTKGSFDILYLSYLEVKHGAPKILLSCNTFRPKRGLWCLSGYIVSREGVKKLLRLLPCRGPIDLWLNHQFKVLDVRATKQSIINQRHDVRSANTYSILPTLTKIGAINSESASLFNIRPTEYPVFAFGPVDTGLSSLSMALLMLGYRCCSDLHELPTTELEQLLKGKSDLVFNAYVNIGNLGANVKELQSLYPNAKFILTTAKVGTTDNNYLDIKNKLKGVDIAVLPSMASNKWQIVCEHLRCAPPTCSYPELRDLGQRPTEDGATKTDKRFKFKCPKRDRSPWVIQHHKSWKGISSTSIDDGPISNSTVVKIDDSLEDINERCWTLRNDTFSGNLALFRPSNVELSDKCGAKFSVKREPLGVREYSAASISSKDKYLFGKFEATIQTSNVPGVITGFFLHRNSPRQEIDIEIAGNRPDYLLTNVFYNPGDEGANFDYGYRGTPIYINLGFDTSKAFHRYAIEWSPCDICWFVDDKLVHRRVIWDPTPIPHLPMALHTNTWLSRSIKLAGRINKKRLPATTTVKNITLEANLLIDSPMPNTPL